MALLWIGAFAGAVIGGLFLAATFVGSNSAPQEAAGAAIACAFAVLPYVAARSMAELRAEQPRPRVLPPAHPSSPPVPTDVVTANRRAGRLIVAVMIVALAIWIGVVVQPDLFWRPWGQAPTPAPTSDATADPLAEVHAVGYATWVNLFNQRAAPLLDCRITGRGGFTAAIPQIPASNFTRVNRAAFQKDGLEPNLREWNYALSELTVECQTPAGETRQFVMQAKRP